MSIMQIGKHKVRHGDVNDNLAPLLGNDKIRLMYSDPPWGTGNIKYWATMNKKMTGAITQPAPLDQFLSSVFNAAKNHVTDYLLIEYGVRWRDDIVARGRAAGFDLISTIDIQYRGGKNGSMLPLDLHVFSKNGGQLPSGYVAHVENSHGFDGVKRAFYPFAELLKEKYPNEEIKVLDPCCGMGYTAQASINCGFAFRGNELNRARLEKTIRRLEKSL